MFSLAIFRTRASVANILHFFLQELEWERQKGRIQETRIECLESTCRLNRITIDGRKERILELEE